VEIEGEVEEDLEEDSEECVGIDPLEEEREVALEVAINIEKTLVKDRNIMVK
jgi:hypothetical protein